MSSLEKLLLQGVRSFSPDEPTVIEFFSPLTLICGQNGAGKTTVIEGLRFATTGEYPPDSNMGRSFVFDPRISSEREVKAKVKLRFCNTAGRVITCTRTLQVAQSSTNKPTLKTLENVLETKDPVSGEKSNLTRKCVDMDKEVPLQLGISKAVLDYVIFCHQEEANWPLGDPNKLKEKFDGIFSSTRYTKALENIKKYRLELNAKLKTLEIDIGHYKIHREKAVELESRLDSLGKSIELCVNRFRDLDSELAPLENNLNAISAEIEEAISVESLLLNEETMLARISSEINELSVKVRVLPDSDKELKEKLQSFKEDMDRIVRENTAKQHLLIEKNSELKNMCLLNQRLRDERTKSRLEKEELDSALQKINELVLEISEIHDIHQPHDLQFTHETAVSEFSSVLRTMIAEKKKELGRLKGELWKRNGNFEKEIDKLRNEMSASEQEKKSKDQMLTQFKLELINTDNELSKIKVSKQDLENLEEELELIKTKISLKTEAAAVEKLQLEKERLEASRAKIQSHMESLHEDIKLFHLQSSSRAKVEQMKERKARIEASIAHLSEQVLADASKWLGTSLKADPFATNEMLRKALQGKREALGGLCLEKQESEVARLSLESQKSREEEEIQHLLLQLKGSPFAYRLFPACVIPPVEKDGLLRSECGSLPFPAAYEKVEKNYSKQQGIYKQIEASQFVIEGYEKVFLEKHYCALCERSFSSEAERLTFHNKLRKKKEKVPLYLNNLKEEVDTLFAKKKRLDQLRIIHEDISRIRNGRLPALQSSLDSIAEKLEEAKQRSERCKTEDLKKDVETLEALLVNSDQWLGLLYDHSELEASISSESLGLHSSEKYATMEEACQKLEALQERERSEASEVEKVAEELLTYEFSVVSLRQELQEKEHQKELLLASLEQLEKYKEKKMLLNASIESYYSDIQSLSHERDSLKEKFEEKVEERAKYQNDKEVTTGNLADWIARLERDFGRFNILLEKVNRLKTSSTLANLKPLEEQLQSLQHEQSQLESTISALKEDLEKKRNIINTQTEHRRNMEDNLHLRKLHLDMSEKKETTQKLANQLSCYNKSGMLESKKELVVQMDRLKEERSVLKGRQHELEKQREDVDRELHSDIYTSALRTYKEKLFSFKTTLVASSDLDKFYKALDATIVQYHRVKMNAINEIIKEMWSNTYSGSDIDTIEIRSESAISNATGRRSYQYRVVMLKGDVEVDMKGRCSAGQKVLASLIIRLALAETFCIHCGILALDEPTANLDRENIEKFAQNLINIIENRRAQRNFQLIVITHDDEFVNYLGQADYVEHYYRVTKDSRQHTCVVKRSFRHHTL